MASAAKPLKAAPHIEPKNNQKCGSKPPVVAPGTNSAGSALAGIGRNRIPTAAIEQSRAMVDNRAVTNLFARAAMNKHTPAAAPP